MGGLSDLAKFTQLVVSGGGLFLASCEVTTGRCQRLFALLTSPSPPASFINIIFAIDVKMGSPQGYTQKHISPLPLLGSSVVCDIMSPAVSSQCIVTSQSRPETHSTWPGL